MDWTYKDSRSKILIVIVTSVIGFVVLSVLFWGGTGYGMMGAGWLFMMAPVLILMIIIYELVDSGQSSNPPSNCQWQYAERASLVTVLDRMYAMGDLPTDEYIRERMIYWVDDYNVRVIKRAVSDLHSGAI